MTRVVLDTNVIISAVFWKGNPYEVIRRGILGEYDLVLSHEILDEVRDKLRNKFQFPEDELHELIDVLIAFCEIITPLVKLEVVNEDPKDNKIVECAIDGKADYVVTGDPHLLKLQKFREIKIVKAKEFLDQI